ncbi:hypothetical protein E4O05_10745 [Treponema sp. OMZ 787]|uniref:hypothetical protein n=1 Tax=Treponema sp. OMZ 787 TaxID=2563669 RepID=UPI0020A592E7|nr:hypothetical protein [Treponema sp. OMZ 787]UTC61986.1 hypothetical protein E4O05_10745 [Treponema sp. OMZ 787]
MKRSTIFKKAIVTTALILSVFILVFGCDNPIETPKNTNVGSTEVISITINGDTYLKEASKKEFNIQKGTTWAVIKKRDEIKNVEFEASYQLSKWLLNGETGSELTDNVKFTEKTILYAKSESIPENSAYVSWEIADNKGGSLKAEYVEKGIKKTLPMGGKKIPVGTKIAFTALPDKENYYEVESWNAGGGGSPFLRIS